MTEYHETTPEKDSMTIKTRNLTIAKSDYKRMHYEEIRELGILHEINRRFLHPLGLALAIMVPDPDAEGDLDQENLVGLMYMIDDRDDPAGTIFADFALDIEKIGKFAEFQKLRHESRLNELGYVIQPWLK